MAFEPFFKYKTSASCDPAYFGLIDDLASRAFADRFAALLSDRLGDAISERSGEFAKFFVDGFYYGLHDEFDELVYDVLAQFLYERLRDGLF